MTERPLAKAFVQDIKLIIGQARQKAVRSVEFHRVEMYWQLGERIFNEEQQGKDRAGLTTPAVGHPSGGGE